MQDTQAFPLCQTLSALLSCSREAFGQSRTYDRACDLVTAAALSFSRKTMTQLLQTLGQTDQDWSAAYRFLSHGRFDPEAASASFFRTILPDVPLDDPFQMVIDLTTVPRSSQKMPGTGWARAKHTAKWAPGLARCQRFVNVCWLTPVQDGYCRAVPLQWRHAPTEKAVASETPACKEWEAGLAGVKWVRQQLDANGRSTQHLVSFADGSYDVSGFWAGLPARTTAVVRTAKNRKLRQLPQPRFETPGQPKRRGAKPKYGERLPTPEALRHESAQIWTKIQLPVRGKTVHIKCRVVGPCLVEGAPDTPLFLVIVKGYHKQGSKKRRQPCQYLVNAVKSGDQWALPLPLEQIISGTWHRWEIEVSHREAKTSFGLGQMQCWSSKGSIASVQFMAWAYAHLIMTGYRTWGGVIKRAVKPYTFWWQGSKRWSLTTLLQALRKENWDLGRFQAVVTPLRSKEPIIPIQNKTLANAALGCSSG